MLRTGAQDQMLAFKDHLHVSQHPTRLQVEDNVTLKYNHKEELLRGLWVSKQAQTG